MIVLEIEALDLMAEILWPNLYFMVMAKIGYHGDQFSNERLT